MKKAVLFDMFFTLADPRTRLETLECEPLGMSPEEWASYFWDPEIGLRRALGEYESGAALIGDVCSRLPFPVTEAQKAAVLQGRLTRMTKALTELQPGVLETVEALHAQGLKLAVVSNADVIDIEAWDRSPLSECFDCVIFSCSAHLVKPEPEIYRKALAELGVGVEEAVFVGDGGDRELAGAKAVGLTTVWTEYLQKKPPEMRALIEPFADHHINDIRELIPLIGKI